MGTIFLLSLFFLRVMNLWSLDCNNGTSAHRGSNFSGIHGLKNRPCDLKLNISHEVAELSEEERLPQKSHLPLWLKVRKAECPQGAGAEGAHTCPPTTDNPPKTLLTEENSTTSGVFLDVTNGSTSNRSSGVISNGFLPFLHSRWLTRFVPSVQTVVFLLSLPLNLLAIITFIFKNQVKTPSVVFMLNLALSDVLFVSMMPFDILYRFSGNNWVIGEGMCRFYIMALYCNIYCSTLLMTSISVDRFLAVVYPVQSLSWRTVSRAWLVCLLIWMVSIATTVPLLMGNLTFYVDQLNITTCCDMLDPSDIQSFYFPYFIFCISVFFFLPFIIITFCYAMTIRRLSSPTIKSPCKRSRSVLLCVTVLCAFTICFGPSNVLYIAYYLTFQKPVVNSVYFAYLIVISVGSINCCLDPAIYYFGSSEYKKHVYSLICCCKTRIGHSQTRGSSGMTGGESSGCA